MTDQYLEEMSKVNLFSRYSPEEMREILKEKSKGNFMENVFQKFPSFEDFLSHWFVSEDALPNFISIFKDKGYKDFMIKSLVIFIIGVILISLLLRKETRIFIRFFQKTILMSLLSLGLLFFFYFSYQLKLDPTVELIKEHMIKF